MVLFAANGYSMIDTGEIPIDKFNELMRMLLLGDI